MRAALVLASLAAAACGRVGFDRTNVRPGDGGSDDASVLQPACVAATGLDWAGGAISNDPGSGLPHAASLTVTADDMAVIDEVTGLAWQRGSSPGLLTFDEATTYCASLTLDGCSLWRLPQRIELASLVDHAEADPVIDPVAFPSTPTDVDWWSATPEAGNNNNAWVVNFANGNSFWQTVQTASHARCVHGGATPDVPPARYQADAGTVLDLDTQLTWQRTVAAGSYSASDAAAYCAGLTLEGSGWRLPSIHELQSIVDSSRTGPAIDATAFPSTPSAPFWSATPFAAGPDQLVLDATDGEVDNQPLATLLRVRCVR